MSPDPSHLIQGNGCDETMLRHTYSIRYKCMLVQKLERRWKGRRNGMPSVSQFWLYPFLADGNRAILQFQPHKGYTSIPIRDRGISLIVSRSQTHPEVRRVGLSDWAYFACSSSVNWMQLNFTHWHNIVPHTMRTLLRITSESSWYGGTHSS